MARTVTDSRQIILRQFLEQLASRTHHDGTTDAKPASATELDNLLTSIDLELKSPLRLDASNPIDLTVSVNADIISNTESSRNRSIPVIDGSLPSFSSGTITFPSSSGGTITVSPGTNGTLTVSSNNYIKVLIHLDSSGNLGVTSGTENSVEASATVPKPPQNSLPIGYVTVFNNAGTIDNIAQSKIYQFQSLSVEGILGDVGSTDNRIVRTDGTNGQKVQGTGIEADDSDNIGSVSSMILGDTIANKDASAKLQIDSTTQGFLVPRMTTTQRDAISSPVEGLKIYNTTTKRNEYYNGTTWTAIGSGSGSGRINFLESGDSNFEGGVGNWIAYDDGAGAFVDGTGGSPTVIGTSHETASPLVDTGSLAITKAASDGSGEGVSVESLSISSQYRGRTVIVEFEQDFTDANYTSEDLEVKAYDITNSEIMTIVGDTLIKNKKGKFQVAISTKINTAQIRLALHLASDSATGSSWTGYIDAALLTIDNTAPAPIVTEWTVFTPTGSWANTSYEGAYRRVGDSIEMFVRASVNGAVSGSLFIDLPTNLSIDTTKLVNASNSDVFNLGLVTLNDNGASDYIGMARYSSTTTLQLIAQNSSGTFSISSAINESSPITIVSGDTVTLKTFFIPISEWSDGAMLSTTETLFSTAKFKASTDAQPSIPNSSFTTVVFEDLTFDSLGAYDTSTGIYTIKKTGTYYVRAQLTFDLGALTDDVGRVIVHINNNNGASFPVRNEKSIGTVDVRESYHCSGIVELTAGDQIKVEIFQDNGGSRLLETGENVFQLFEIPDFSVFSVYNETEVLEANNSSFTLIGGTSNEYQDLDSLTLTPGEWELTSHVGWDEVGGPVSTQVVFSAISENSGNTITDHIDGKNVASSRIEGSAGDRVFQTITSLPVTLSETKTYYLKAKGGTSHTNLAANYYFKARRIK